MLVGEHQRLCCLVGEGRWVGSHKGGVDASLQERQEIGPADPIPSRGELFQLAHHVGDVVGPLGSGDSLPSWNPRKMSQPSNSNCLSAAVAGGPDPCAMRHSTLAWHSSGWKKAAPLLEGHVGHDLEIFLDV